MNKYPAQKRVSCSKNSSDLRQSTALAAVALQDQLVRDLSLNFSNPLNRPCNIPRAKAKPRPRRAVIDTGRTKTQTTDRKAEQEYVLDAKPAKLTLAQKLGLIEAPEQPLSEAEWKKVKEKSCKRDDFKQPCVICKEDFGVQEQALLSCTHVFHKACIQAFERFTGKKSCPMCRKEQYQTRIVYEGATYYKHKCATKIQALWRGYIVRSWYVRLRQTVPPKDPKLRKKFFEQKLHDITERMLRSVDNDIDGFLQELDRSLEASRDVFRRFDDVTRVMSEDEWEAVQIKALERDVTDCPICLTPLKSHDSMSVTKATNSAKIPKEPKMTSKSCRMTCKNSSQTSAKRLTSKCQPSKDKHLNGHVIMGDPTKGRGQDSLPCNSAESQSRPVDTPNKPAGNQTVRAQVLLSCSHIFHQTCLETFEELAAESRKFICPVCRSHYQKRLFS